MARWSKLPVALITVAISYLDLPVPMAVAVALLVASVKGALVACYFMHLIAERKLIYAVLLVTAAMFIPLLLLPVFTQRNGFGFHQ